MNNENSLKPKTSFLRKIFSKTSYTINNKTIVKPRSKAFIPLLAFLAFFIFCSYFIPTKGITIKPEEFGVLIKRMFSPETGITGSWKGWFEYMWDLRKILLETLRMTFLGTFIGTVLAVPFSVICSRNVVKTAWIYEPARLIMNFIRTIPTLVLAVVAMFFYGIGAFPGIVSMSIFSFGLMTKMLYEIIETVDMGPFEALEATGADKIQAFRMAIVPQILPVFIGYFIYCFEINVRGSVILGYVGAGGIGVELDNAISLGYAYDRVGAIVVVLFALILIIQSLTRYTRGKLL